MPRMEEMRTPHLAQGAHGTAQILVISCDQQSAASLVKPNNALAVCGGEAVPRVHGEQPEFIDVRAIEHAQHRILRSHGGAIARRHAEEWMAGLVDQRGQIVGEQGKAPNVPVIISGGNGRLQQDVDRSRHGR